MVERGGQQGYKIVSVFIRIVCNIIIITAILEYCPVK